MAALRQNLAGPQLKVTDILVSVTDECQMTLQGFPGAIGIPDSFGVP